ncbi:MAG: ribonucleoside triphosphate reductase, partial [Deltaproteobacteria bacterium]|nr:ribonucleoside triphosphate reductase [Deltaproteobacteria bacterium]
NHFSTIGLIGGNEACLNLLGCDIGSEEGRAFAGRMLDHMRDTLTRFQEETGNHYNLEATPAEGTGFRLASLDMKRFPEMRTRLTCPDSGTPIYSNSTQLPVNYTDDIFEVLDLQDDLQTKYTGGTVLHSFLGEAVADPQAVRSYVNKVCHNYHLPYFTVTPSFAICPSHGYLRGEVGKCPSCGEKTEVYSRVVGYMRPVDQWNEGKQAEFSVRSHYRVEV